MHYAFSCSRPMVFAGGIAVVVVVVYDDWFVDVALVYDDRMLRQHRFGGRHRHAVDIFFSVAQCLHVASLEIRPEALVSRRPVDAGRGVAAKSVPVAAIKLVDRHAVSSHAMLTVAQRRVQTATRGVLLPRRPPKNKKKSTNTSPLLLRSSTSTRPTRRWHARSCARCTRTSHRPAPLCSMFRIVKLCVHRFNARQHCRQLLSR